MTEERFEELTNLYFDKEITRQQLGELRAELENDPDRKSAFLERIRFEQASRKALYSKTRRSLLRSLSATTQHPPAATAESFGLLRWSLLAACLCIIALQWLRLAPANDFLADFDPLTGGGVHADAKPIQSLSVAEVVEIRGLILQIAATEIEGIEVAIDAVVANRREPSELGAITADDQPSPQVSELIRVAEQQPRRLNRPLEIYPFHGNIRQDLPQPPAATMPSAAPSMRFQTVGLENNGSF